MTHFVESDTGTRRNSLDIVLCELCAVPRGPLMLAGYAVHRQMYLVGRFPSVREQEGYRASEMVRWQEGWQVDWVPRTATAAEVTAAQAAAVNE